MSEIVKITRDELEALIADREELAELRAYDHAMANHTEGLPADLVEQIIFDDVSPLKAIRKWRGLTQTALAEQSGVNAVQIGDIESRGRTGSPATLMKLAKALNVSVEFLILDDD